MTKELASEIRKGAELSPREREVLTLLAEGLTYKEIGHRLNISVKTVDTHKYHLLLKLNIGNKAGLIRYAIREELAHA